MISRAELEGLMLRISRLEDEVKHLQNQVMPRYYIPFWDSIDEECNVKVVQNLKEGNLDFFRREVPVGKPEFGSYRDHIGQHYKRLIARFMKEPVSEISLDEIGIILEYITGWAPNSHNGILLFFLERGFELKLRGNLFKWSNIIPFE